MYSRFSTKRIKIGNGYIGGGSPVAVQSMLNRPAGDIGGNVAQAKELERAGCDIIRVAVPDFNAVRLIYAVKSAVGIPLVADIHFDYRLAIESAAAGADKIRINPGNIGEDDKVKRVAAACKSRGIPIRIGVNSGSLKKATLEKYGSPTAAALAESAEEQIRTLERFDFNDIVVSIKSSSPKITVEAYKAVAERFAYPLHLGVTEAGTEYAGVVRSAVGIGSLLLNGIGDTLRVSLTADPVAEVRAAKEILRACDLPVRGITFISCPTCGRTKIDLLSLANGAEKMLAGCDLNITVAIMGCAVNGPGEAREADIGIAGGDGCGLVFKKGEIVRRVPEEELLPALMSEINNIKEQRES